MAASNSQANGGRNSLLFLAGSAFVFLFKDQLMDLSNHIADSVYNWLYTQFTINTKQNPKTKFAFSQELSKLNRYKQKVLDGRLQPNYGVANGSYKIRFNGSTMYIDIEDDKITVTCFWAEPADIQDFINTIYTRHCSPQKVVVFYGLEENKWSFPIFRRPRDLTKVKITSSMEKVLSDVAKFKNSEQKYKNKGHPYRRGYFLEGPPGANKSTVVEIVAIKYNMSVYMCNINSENMTDAKLVNLVSSVPPNSIIIFEEVDEQLINLKNLSSRQVSNGGILSALDGPQRLSHGSIVIMTANSSSTIDTKFKTALFRKGRIDKHFIFDKN